MTKDKYRPIRYSSHMDEMVQRKARAQKIRPSELIRRAINEYLNKK